MFKAEYNTACSLLLLRLSKSTTDYLLRLYITDFPLFFLKAIKVAFEKTFTFLDFQKINQFLSYILLSCIENVFT